MEKIESVIFDCDGVMFDSGGANRAYYNTILNHFGRPELTGEQFAYTHMHTADESMIRLFGEGEDLEAAQAFRRKMTYLPFIGLMRMEPDLLRLLGRLRPQYRTAISTNRSDTMQRVLADHRLEGYFDAVVTSLDVERPKPHPDSLFRALELIGTAPENAVYIGDSKVDEEAAHAAGVLLIAYRNPRLCATYHIASLGEVEGILETRGPART